jgi:predicted RNase H-like nuclease (RuvC/YqgF family)
VLLVLGKTCKTWFIYEISAVFKGSWSNQMIKRFLTWFFSNSNEKEKYRAVCVGCDEPKQSLAELISKIQNKIESIQEELEYLKNENIELTNSLYECENRLESRIDSIHPVVYNIRTKLDDQNV